MVVKLKDYEVFFFFFFVSEPLIPSGQIKISPTFCSPEYNLSPLSSFLQLLHPVEGAASLEPFDLRLVEAMV